jgi:type II secretory ATPase GspE/PulE/Tfp pilus assembly ATPase PilB-like protein
MGLSDGEFFEPVGCDQCHNMGYRGRSAIQEILIPSEAVQEAVMGQDLDRIREAAQKNGMRTLFEDGLRYAAKGITSLTEVARVASTSRFE